MEVLDCTVAVDLFQRQPGLGQAGDVLWFSWLTSAQGLLFVVLVALSLVLLVLIIIFPAIATWLPALLG